MVRRYDLEVGLVVIGSLVALGGAYVPSVRPPDQPPATPVPEFLIPGLDPGIGLLDLPVLAVSLLLLATYVQGARTRKRASLAILTGALALVVAVVGVFGNPMVGFDAPYVPGAGWYLTLLGGALLLVAGGVGLSELVAELVDRAA